MDEFRDTEIRAEPFGRRASGMRRWLMVSAGIVGLLAIGMVVYLVAGGGQREQSAEAEHNHAVAPVTDSARAVSLSDAERHRIGVTFTKVERSPLQRQVRTVAQVAYDETRVKDVVPRVDGYVEQLYVGATGQPVVQGEPLFTIYSPMLVTTQEEMLLAKRLTEQVKGGTPDAVQGAAALLESARTRLRYWEVPADAIDRVLRTGVTERTITLRSPVAGVVVVKSVTAGQRLMAGEQAYRIVDLSRVWIEGEVFEPDLPAVQVGQRVSAEFPALPGVVRSGRIGYVYPTLNPETRTARVRVEMANPDLHLKPGMYATFRFSAQTASVLNVPRSSVLVTGKRALVFVRDSTGVLVPREVTLGQGTDDRIEVLSGLREGETVVASATFLVDAESNLGSALGGMANMPGMEITTPPQRLAPDSLPGARVPAAPSDPTMPDMPGMNHGGDTARPE
ncbi:MAG TPA: efflux RND transporter periplasmic adaptor subunit [Gemmatimonadales bacterium]|nr:efflux RND transporter periplasmic adaptor subunit [Gemmatimonadales bacterium]